MDQRPQKLPTLKTIAELSGLAVPTVSRALSDAPDIGEKTKARVQKIAKEIGYVPNRAGVRLKTGKTNVIALVLSTDHGIVNRTARLIASSAGALRGTRYHLNVMPYFPAEDPMTPVRYIVETRSADAVILNQTLPDDPRVEYLLEANFPLATHGRTNWADRHSYYDFDNHAFTEQAIAVLAERGRSNILVVAPPPGQNYAQDILNAMESGGRASNVWTGALEGATSDDSDDVLFEALVKALRNNPKIDAIIGCSTPATMCSAAAIEYEGKTVGQELDVIGKETSPLLHLFRPAIINYFEDIRIAGEFLGKAAIEAVENPDAPPRQMLEVPSKDLFRTQKNTMTARFEEKANG